MADWGYNTEEERAAAAALPGVRLLSLPDFCELLRWGVVMGVSALGATAAAAACCRLPRRPVLACCACAAGGMLSRDGWMQARSNQQDGRVATALICAAG